MLGWISIDLQLHTPDRILLHVMPDRRSRVRIDAYEACDAVSCSDHKYVYWGRNG